MKLNIYRPPDDTIHISRFGGEVAGVMKLNEVPQTYLCSAIAYSFGNSS
jgi:hypothetical protein